MPVGQNWLHQKKIDQLLILLLIVNSLSHVLYHHMRGHSQCFFSKRFSAWICVVLLSLAFLQFLQFCLF